MNPMDSQTPGKMEIGMGYGSVSIVPMARGQGARYTGMTYELFSGHPLFYEEILVYPVGQDSILRIESSPQSVLRIPYLLDIKAGDVQVRDISVEAIK